MRYFIQGNTITAVNVDEGDLSLRCVWAITILTLTAIIPNLSDGKKPQMGLSFMAFLLLKLLESKKVSDKVKSISNMRIPGNIFLYCRRLQYRLE